MRNRGAGVVIEESVEVHRPVEDVFDYCTDIAHEPEWNPHTHYAEKLTDGPVREGTRYKAEWVEGEPMIVEYVAVDRPRSWLTTGRSRRLVTTGEGHVVPTDDGARLDVRMVLEPRGLMSVITPVLGRLMRRRERENLRALKVVLESSPDRPATRAVPGDPAGTNPPLDGHEPPTQRKRARTSSSVRP